MAIAFRSQTSLGGTAATVSAIKPSGAVAGDVLIVDIITAGATVTVVPSGWTQITNVQTGLTARLFAYWHVVGASDPGPWDFTLSVSGAYSHICACYSAVDNTTPLDVAATTVGNNTAGTSIVVPAVSPVTANTMLHSGVGEGATNRTITNPAGMTSIVEVTVGRRQEAAWQAIAATGTTGTRTWTFSASAVYNAYMVPLRPSAGGTPATLVGTAATATAAAGASTFAGQGTLAGTAATATTQAEASTFTGGGGGGYATITKAGSNKVGSAAVTAGTPITITKPIGYTSALDDLIVVALGTRSTAATAFTLAGGSGTWTESVHGREGAAAPSGAIWWKRVTDTTTEDAATWTYSMDTSAQSAAAVVVYRNVDATTAIHATTTPATGALGTTATANTLTPTTDGTMLIFAVAWNASSSVTITTQPSGYTKEQENTSQARVDYYDLLETTATASTPAEVMSGANNWVAMLIALKPASTGGAGATFAAGTATATAQAEATTFKGASTLVAATATTTSAAGASALLGQAKLTGTAATATSQAEASAIKAASTFIAAVATATAQAEPSTFRTATAATFVAGTATATTQAEASALAGQGKLAATAATATAQASASAITAASKLIAAAATATAQAEASNFSAGGAVAFPGGTATANATAPQSTLAAQAKLTATAATSTAAAGTSTFGIAATFVAGTATATAAAGASVFKAASKLIAASATATAQAESASFLAGGAVTFAAGTATASAAASASTLRAGASLLGSPASATALAGIPAFLAAARMPASTATAQAAAGASDMVVVIFAPPLTVLTTRARPVLVADGPDVLTAPGRVAVLTGDHE